MGKAPRKGRELKHFDRAPTSMCANDGKSSPKGERVETSRTPRGRDSRNAMGKAPRKGRELKPRYHRFCR